MKYLIAINYVDYDIENKKISQDLCINYLKKYKNISLASINFIDDNVDLPDCFQVIKNLKRDCQKEIGNNRRLPYIKELLDICSDIDCNVFGYINSDILINDDFLNDLSCFNEGINACIFYKKDIRINGDKIDIVNEYPHGQDGFFFNKKWWISNRNFYPSNLILGETEWDTCYNSITQNISNYLIKRSLLHIDHERIWSLDSRGAINNKIIWDLVKNSYGLPLYNPESIKK